MNDILDELSGTGFPAVKWADIGLGNHIVGTLIDVPTKAVKDKLNADRSSLPFGIELPDGTQQTLWVGTSSQLGSAIKDAVRSHGPNEKIQLGGKLTVKWDSSEPPKQAGHSPMRVFKAKYEPPADSGMDVSEIF
jgi:hypothetical protein